MYEQLFTCECIDEDFFNFQHGRGKAQVERTTQQQEESAQNDKMTERRTNTERVDDTTARCD